MSEQEKLRALERRAGAGAVRRAHSRVQAYASTCAQYGVAAEDLRRVYLEALECELKGEAEQVPADLTARDYRGQYSNPD